jgi:multidrug efflux pump subunit AcrA (membrane-fusion protein)
MYINPELDSADRSLKVIAEVNNGDGMLKGGLFAKGRIIVGKRSSVLQLPRQSLSGWDTTSKKGVIFVIDVGVAKARQVATGAVNSDLVEIVSGVKAGEKYVIRGGFNLKDGDKVALPANGGQK